MLGRLLFVLSSRAHLEICSELEDVRRAVLHLHLLSSVSSSTYLNLDRLGHRGRLQCRMLKRRGLKWWHRCLRSRFCTYDHCSPSLQARRTSDVDIKIFMFFVPLASFCNDSERATVSRSHSGEDTRFSRVWTTQNLTYHAPDCPGTGEQRKYTKFLGAICLHKAI